MLIVHVESHTLFTCHSTSIIEVIHTPSFPELKIQVYNLSSLTKMIHNNSLSLLIIMMIFVNLSIPSPGAYNTSCLSSWKHDDNADEQKSQCSRFTTTFECFFPLVDNEYWIKARRESTFQENISLSMYRYYMAQHLYARLVQIKAAKGLATRTERKFANHVQSIAPSVPYGTFTYLNAIGDIEIMKTNKNNESYLEQFFEYSFISWPNEWGHFGPVDCDSHWMYMSFPAPIMVAIAVQADLTVEDHQSLWKPKSKYIPNSERYGVFPTPNWLGWKPAAAVTIAQRQNLHLSGITRDDYDVINSQFQFNPKLMTIVHSYFRASPQAAVNMKTWYTNKRQNVGTMEQLTWLEREVSTNPSVSKTFAFIEKDVLAMLHPLQAGTRYLSKLSLIMGFRVKKYAVPSDWAIFDWGHNGSIPQCWVQTRNAVFEFGDIGDISGTAIPFSYDRDGIRTEFLERCYEGRPMYQ
ncbi:uncharacterized protein LOC135167789 [Diachasmimorpha longicaudata]|uniref:uncharacterized protein LOC135167789 n=1 Tax=Diachasmimorpha longicaudata TaxID=58733 RepID=UPI0030B8DCA4